MGNDSAAGRFWLELEALYQAAGRPTLRVLVQLGESQHPPISVSASTVNGWLNGKAVPAGRKNTRYVIAMVTYLRARVSPGSSYAPPSAGEWGRMLRAAQAERAAGRKKGRPRAQDASLLDLRAREPVASRPPAIDDAPLAAMAPSPEVCGRDGELAALAGLIESVVAGHGGVVLVDGEPGIGKSSVVRAALGDFAVSACRVFWGTGSELDQALPLQPLLDGLRVREASPSPRRQVIARLVRGETPVDHGLNGSAVLAEQLLALIAEECAAHPVILVMDDLQWADQASIGLLGRAIALARDLPLLVIGITRPVPRRSELQALRRIAAEATRLGLTALNDEAVAELVAALAGATPDRQLLDLASDAAGNPLYITELMEAMVRSSRVTISPDGIATLADGPVPRSLTAAIGDRLGFLSDSALEVLRTASLLGIEFTVPDLAILRGSTAGDLSGVLREACAAGVLAESGSRLRFRHPLIHAALYEAIPAPVRAAWHREAARALAAAKVPADRVARQLLSMAPAADTSPEPLGNWALNWLTGAAEALASQAPFVATMLLRQAVNSATFGSPGYAQLASRLANALYHIGEHRAAEELASQLLSSTTDPDLLVDLQWTLTLCRMEAGRQDESIASLAVAFAAPDLSSRHHGRLLILAARTHLSTGELRKGSQCAEKALKLAEEASDTWTMAWAMHILALAAMQRGELSSALSLFDRGLAATRIDPTLTDLRLLLQINRAATLGNLGRHDEAWTTASQARQLADKIGTTIRRAQAYGVSAELLFGAGRWNEALSAITVVPSSLKEPVLACMELGVAALIALHRGDVSVADGCLREVAEHAGRVSRLLIPTLVLARSLSLEQRGALPEALSELTGWLDGGSEELQQADDLIPDAVRLAIKASALTVARVIASQANRSVQRSRVAFQQANHLYCHGLLERNASLLIIAGDRYQQSTRPLHSAMALEAAAAEFARVGKQEEALAALSRAAGVYAALGATVDEARVAAAMASYARIAEA